MQLMRMWNGAIPLENSLIWQFLKTLSMYLPYNPKILLIDIYLRKTEVYVLTKN